MSSLGVENRPLVSADPADVEGKKKSGTEGKKKEGKSGRKMLQTLQPSGKNQKLLIGPDGLLRLGSSGKKDIKIYQDPSAPLTSTPERKEPVHKLVQASVHTTTSQTQVTEADKAETWMYAAEDELPLEYWKDLAEKRRVALDESLNENESLHTSLSFLEEERDELKEEVETYKSLAEHAAELANILDGVVSEEEEDKEEEEEDKVEDVEGEQREQGSHSKDEEKEAESVEKENIKPEEESSKQ